MHTQSIERRESEPDGEAMAHSRRAAERLWEEICRHLAGAAAGIRYQTVVDG